MPSKAAKEKRRLCSTSVRLSGVTEEQSSGANRRRVSCSCSAGVLIAEQPFPLLCFASSLLLSWQSLPSSCQSWPSPQNRIGHLFSCNLCLPFGAPTVMNVISDGVVSVCPIHQTLKLHNSGWPCLMSTTVCLISVHWEIIQLHTKYFICLEFYA